MKGKDKDYGAHNQCARDEAGHPKSLRNEVCPQLVTRCSLVPKACQAVGEDGQGTSG